MNAEHFEATNEQYHAMDGISNSRLSDAIDDAQLFWGRYLCDPPLYPRVEATEAMQFGTNCHGVIQAGRVDAVFTIIPREALNGEGHRKGAAWKDFYEAHEGETLVKAEEVEVYQRILDNVKAHDRASRILYGNDGHNEFNIRWTDNETGLPMRARLDRVRPSVLIADIKTTTAKNNRELAQAIYAWGYHRQAHIYREAWMELTGEVLDFAFVFIRKSAPHTVFVRDLAPSFLEIGEQEVRAALADLRRRTDANDWTTNTEIETLEEPRYTRYQSEWETA